MLTLRKTVLILAIVTTLLVPVLIVWAANVPSIAPAVMPDGALIVAGVTIAGAAWVVFALLCVGNNLCRRLDVIKADQSFEGVKRELTTTGPMPRPRLLRRTAD